MNPIDKFLRDTAALRRQLCAAERRAEVKRKKQEKKNAAWWKAFKARNASKKSDHDH